MAVEIVFNELSLKTPFDSKQAARRLMTKFIDTLRTSTGQGAKRKLCTMSNFDYLELSGPLSSFRPPLAICSIVHLNYTP